MVAYPRLVFALVSRIIIRRDRLELGGAGIDQLEHGADPPPLAVAADFALGGFPQRGQLPVGEPVLLGQPDQFVTGLFQRAGLSQPALDLHQFFDVGQEPGVDSGDRVDTIDIHASKERIADVPDALGVGDGELGLDLVIGRLARGAPEVFLVAAQAEAADFQPAEGLLKRLLERPADGHDLADRLHLGGQHRVGLGELLERPAGNLGHHVVDRRLEAGRGLAGDVVANLVEPEADGQLGRDLGDREPSRLAGQRA